MNISCKNGHIKDRNSKDQREAEQTKKRWREYTEELNLKSHSDQDNHNGVDTHLQPDILGCEVKWTLGRITMNKAGGGDGISAYLFEIPKDDAFRMLCSIHQQIWKTQQSSQDCKKSAFTPIPKKSNAKECSNYHTISLISQASKVVFKSLQDRL